MIYKFKSKATGDLIMLGPHGDQVLRLMGREPAAQGIIEPAALPAALAALQDAVAAEGAARSGAAGGSATVTATATAVGGKADTAIASDAAADTDTDTDADADEDAPRGVALRQRVWPMVEMLRRALAADVAVVWGV